MADIAQLGFSADTNELKDATASLNALAPAAAKAQSATEKFNRAAAGITGAADGAAAGIRSFGAAVNQAASGGDKLSRGALMAGTAMGTVQRAAAGASAGINVLGAGAVRNAGFFAIFGARISAFLERLRGVTPAANGATTSLDRLGKHANDNINRMQATPGNIAAQFQDIGVTAAAGMNPMIIALQQGTQLSAAMSGGIGNLARAFAQIFSPVTLLTIGLVGLLAAGLQMVDWIKVAQGLLNGLADVMQETAVAAVYLGGVLLIAFAPQLIGWIVRTAIAIGTTLVTAIRTATLAMVAFSLANPFTAFVLAVGVAVAALTYFGVITKQQMNFVIGTFVGGFNIVRDTWSMLPAAIGDAVITTGNRVNAAVVKMVNDSIDAINGMIAKLPDWMGGGAQIGHVAARPWANPFAGAAGRAAGVAQSDMAAARGVDYVGKAGALIDKGAKYLSDKLHGWADALGEGDDAKTKAGKAARGRTPRAAKAEKSNEDLFGEVLADADKQMRSLQQAKEQIGVYGEALDRMKYQQQLLNAATDKGVKLNFAMALVLMQRADAMAKLATQNAHDTLLEGMKRSHEETMTMLDRERGAIGLSGVALDAYNRETALLTQARQKNIDLNAKDLAGIHAYAQGEAEKKAAIDAVTEALKKQREIQKDIVDAQKSFIKDFVTGLREGKSVLDSLNEALNNFIDKLLDKGMDALLDSLFKSNSGGGGGFFAKLLGNLTGGVSAGPNAALTGDVSATMAANPGLFAKGDVFKYANGGSFTNGIYDRPTMFQFARGTALGQMGEAGPEAVMPLKRGPDGSLGVQLHGGKGDLKANVTVHNHYNLEGAISPKDVVKMIEAGGKQTETSVKKQLVPWLEQWKRDGGVS